MMFIISFIIFLPVFVILVLICYVALKSMIVMCETTTGAMSELVEFQKNQKQNKYEK